MLLRFPQLRLCLRKSGCICQNNKKKSYAIPLGHTFPVSRSRAAAGLPAACAPAQGATAAQSIVQGSSALLSAPSTSKPDGSQEPLPCRKERYHQHHSLFGSRVSQLLLSFCWHSKPLLSEGNATCFTTLGKQLASHLRQEFPDFVQRGKCTGGISNSFFHAAPVPSSPHSSAAAPS